MKNIRIYNAEKYAGDLYEEVEPNIYKTYEMPSDDDGCLSLDGITDEEKIKMLSNLEGWKRGETEFEEDFYIIVHEGRKYYKDIDDEDPWFYENPNDNGTPILSYVTSIVYEPEPEYGENDPSDPNISQYPLEDILDEFFCECADFYDKENESDPLNSYIEFSSSDIEDIRKLLTIIGKHVYNKEDGDYVKLMIEE